MIDPEIGQVYIDKIDAFRSACRAIVADSEDCGDYQTGTFRYLDTAAQITADYHPENTGFDCLVNMYGGPMKDDNDQWVLPVTNYNLDDRGVLRRTFDVEDDQSIIEKVVSERVRELLDLPPRQTRKIPDELREIIERDPESLEEYFASEIKDFLREGGMGPNVPKRLAHEIGSRTVSLFELNNILKILDVIRLNPQAIV